VAIGKMLGGGLPLSALLGPREILTDPLIIENAHLHSTHSDNPFICNVGCQVIEGIQQGELVQHSLDMGAILDGELKDIPVRHHSGRGLLAGLEMAGPVEARKLVEACRRRGLLVVDTGRKWVKIGPALIITEEEIVKGCKILKAAIEEVMDETEAQRNIGQEPSGSGGDLQADGVRDVPEDGTSEGTEDEGRKG
jgi:4-aminobutyrate aminotransferase